MVKIKELIFELMFIICDFPKTLIATVVGLFCSVCLYHWQLLSYFIHCFMCFSVISMKIVTFLFLVLFFISISLIYIPLLSLAWQCYI